MRWNLSRQTTYALVLMTILAAGCCVVGCKSGSSPPTVSTPPTQMVQQVPTATPVPTEKEGQTPEQTHEIRSEPAVVPTDSPIPSATPTPLPTSTAPKAMPLPLAYQPPNNNSFVSQISPDGRYVAFWSYAGNLVDDDERDCGQPEKSLSCSDVFVYDRQTRTMERIPVGEGYGLGGGGYKLSLSEDGRYVVFRGTIRDRQTQLQSAFCGLDVDAQSRIRASILSADGRWIAFTDGQVYLCDRQSGTVTPVSVAPDGAPADGPSGLVTGHEGYSDSLSLSADGRWLAFTSQASNLVPGQTKDKRCQRPLAVLPDAPHCYDVYLYDRETGAMALLGEPWRTARD